MHTKHHHHQRQQRPTNTSKQLTCSHSPQPSTPKPQSPSRYKPPCCHGRFWEWFDAFHRLTFVWFWTTWCCYFGGSEWGVLVIWGRRCGLWCWCGSCCVVEGAGLLKDNFGWKEPSTEESILMWKIDIIGKSKRNCEGLTSRRYQSSTQICQRQISIWLGYNSMNKRQKWLKKGKTKVFFVQGEQ